VTIIVSSKPGFDSKRTLGKCVGIRYGGLRCVKKFIIKEVSRAAIRTDMIDTIRQPQVCVLGSAEPGSKAYDLAGQAGELLARLGITVISGCGSPATRIAAQRAQAAGGMVVSIITNADMPAPDWPATVVIPCGMGDARNLIMALAGDACIVIGGRAGTISEVCLAWLHRRPLLPLMGCGGWSDGLLQNPPDERQNSPILPWDSMEALESQLNTLRLLKPESR
jgi:uncharacterized protein (TIGR00725 family)